ncbi:unnamed protein product, partial [Discosporangium mesarthrocarpum]
DLLPESWSVFDVRIPVKIGVRKWSRMMKKKRYTEEQIAFALRQHESGTAVSEIVRKRGI